MKLSPVEELCLDLQGIWINKAQYVDAERQFQIAVQEANRMATSDPKKQKNFRSKKSRSIKIKPIDELVEAVRYEAQKKCPNPSKYVDAERLLIVYKQNQQKNQRDKKYGLTPYQGGRRCFGKFKCKSCNWKWASAYSWANSSQQCRRCDQNVYPYKQTPPSKFGKVEPKDERKEHDTTKCEKCRRTNGDCRNLSFGFKRRAQRNQ